VTRYRFIEQAKRQLGARRCCRVLGVSLSSYYHWRRRVVDPCARQRADQRLLGQITRIYRQSGDAYGAPRVHAELGDRLRGEGGPQAGGAADALGGAGGLPPAPAVAAGADPPRPTGHAGAGPVPAPVQPTRPDRMWHADYTELPTDQGTL